MILSMVILLYGKKQDISDIYLQQPDQGFSCHISLTTIEDFSLLEKSREEKKVAAAEQGNFYW